MNGGVFHRCTLPVGLDNRFLGLPLRPFSRHLFRMQMPMGAIPIPAPQPQGPYAKLKAAIRSYGKVECAACV